MIGVLVALAIICLVVMVIDEMGFGGCLVAVVAITILALLALAL